MNGAFVNAVTDVPLQLQLLENARSASTFEKSLLDLSDPSMPTSCGVNPQVSQDVVVLGIMLLKVGLKRPGRFLAAGNEAGLVRVDLEARRHEQFPQGPIGQLLSGHVVRISATNVKGYIIDPCLKGRSWVCALELFERPKEDQLADGRSLRAALEDAMRVVFGVPSNALSLYQSRTRIQIQCQLEVDRRIVELSSRLQDAVQVDGVIKTGQISQARDRVDSLALANFRLEHASDRDGEAVSFWSGLIPRKVVIQSHLPALDVMLPVRIPNSIEARCQGNGTFHLGRLGNENDVGVPQLSRQQGLPLHLGEKGTQSLDRRKGQVPKHIIRDSIRPRSFVGKSSKELLQNRRVNWFPCESLLLSNVPQLLQTSDLNWCRKRMPNGAPLLFPSLDAVQGWQILKRPLPCLIPLSKVAKEASQTFVMSGLEPFLELKAGGLKCLLLGNVFLLQDLCPEFPRIRSGRLQPLPNHRSKDISRKVRAELVDILEHVLDVLRDSRVPGVVDHIDADVEFLPKGDSASEPLP